MIFNFILLQTTSASPWIIYVTDFVSLIYNLKAVL